MKRQAGFTLIELITVIVILGALSVVAIPKFIDLQDDAELAALEGVVGAAGAATALNLAAHLAGDSDAETVTTCAETEATLAAGALPTGYTVAPEGGATSFPNGTDTGDAGLCTVTQTSTTNTANFTAYYVS